MKFILIPYILTLLNLAIACGTPPMDTPSVIPVDNPRTQTSQPPVVDDELLEAVQQWKEDCYRLSQLHCGSLLNKVDSITVVEGYKEPDGKPSPFTIGQCRVYNYGPIVTQRTVTIRRDVLLHKNTLRATLAHEMGHCIWLLDHTEDETHLMAAFIMSEKVLDRKLNEMLARLYRDISAGSLPTLGVFDND